MAELTSNLPPQCGGDRRSVKGLRVIGRADPATLGRTPRRLMGVEGWQKWHDWRRVCWRRRSRITSIALPLPLPPGALARLGAFRCPLQLLSGRLQRSRTRTWPDCHCRTCRNAGQALEAVLRPRRLTLFSALVEPPNAHLDSTDGTSAPTAPHCTSLHCIAHPLDEADSVAFTSGASALIPPVAPPWPAGRQVHRRLTTTT